MIDWGEVAPMVVAVVFILTTGGVLLLRPIARRLGDILEIMAREKQDGIQSDVGHIRDLLETMNARLQLLEERQDFTERLLSGEQGKKREELPRAQRIESS